MSQVSAVFAPLTPSQDEMLRTQTIQALHLAHEDLARAGMVIHQLQVTNKSLSNALFDLAGDHKSKNFKRLNAKLDAMVLDLDAHQQEASS